MFCLWDNFSQRVCHIQIRKYFANFYVNNALHGATLAYCSHFQYVSRSRLRVIQICVKTCIDVTFYDEPFSIIEKHILIPLRIILTNVQWSTPRSLLYSLAKNSVGYTIDLVHSMAYFIELMAKAYGMTFILFLYSAVVGLWVLLSFTPCNTGKNSFFDCSILNYFKILSRYVLIEKTYQGLDLSLYILMLNM